MILTGGALRRHVVRNARELGAARLFALDGDPAVLGADAGAKYTDLGWRASLDAFDPERAGLVLGSNFHSRPEFANRRFVGARREPWRRWEDKTAVVDLWTTAGIEVAPTRVVPAEIAQLTAAADDLDDGHGTVWAGDHRDGEHHSGRHLRWVRTRPEAEDAAEHFAARCEVVRVTPFLPGQSCSVHGYVAVDGVAVLRPIAQLIERNDEKGTFTYTSCDLDWSPTAEVVHQMRSAARAVGEALSATCDYRGAFTLDGIATTTTFLPTETNTRFGAGLTLIAQRMPDIPLRLLHAFMADSENDPWKPAELEQMVRARLPDLTV